LPEARTYIEASWRSVQKAEVGLHLGDLELAEKQPSAALATYQLAQAAIPAGSMHLSGKATVFTSAPGFKEISDKLEAGIARARRAGAVSKGEDARAALLKLRTYKLGSAGTRHGYGEYRLLVANGKVERAVPAGDAKVAGADGLLRSLDVSGMVPAGSAAKLALAGYVNCTTTCEFIVSP
jgi:hypothetical protein